MNAVKLIAASVLGVFGVASMLGGLGLLSSAKMVGGAFDALNSHREAE